MSQHDVWPADSQLTGPSQAVVRTDWSKCILCQKVASEILRCSADSKRRDVGTGKGILHFYVEYCTV